MGNDKGLYNGIGDDPANFEEDYEQASANQEKGKANANGGKDGMKLAKKMAAKTPDRGYMGRG